MPKISTSPGFSHDFLLKRLSYDPLAGEFLWRDGWNIGKRARVLSKGRWYVYPAGRHRLAARVAWFYMTGEWPTKEIDHINCDSCDDRWNNLREASRAENLANMRIRPNNTSGFKGVSFDKSRGKWIASISIGNRFKNLGRFDRPEDAHAAYCAASRAKSGEFARAA